MSLSFWPSAPTVAPSGLGGGGGDRDELIVTWTVSGKAKLVSSIFQTELNLGLYVSKFFIHSLTNSHFLLVSFK